jgi:hypothetical protein
MSDLVAQLVREWVERQLSEHQVTEKPRPPSFRRRQLNNPRVLQGLQKLVREFREKLFSGAEWL